MNDLERKQARIVMESIAQMAAHNLALVNMIFEDEGNISRNAQILGAIEALAKQTGLMADQWAGDLGGSCIKASAENWLMPPIFFPDEEDR